MSQTPRKISVLLVDPEGVPRYAIRRYLNSLPNIDVIADVCDSAQANEVLSKKQIDVVISEMALPDSTGLDFLASVTKAHELSKFLFLSSLKSVDIVKQALMSGAYGYVFKTGELGELISAIKHVSNGHRYVPSQVVRLLDIPDNFYSLNSDVEFEDPLFCLSTREREIFYLLASGLANSMIARKLLISPRTVEAHRARIILKLKLESSADLIHYAFKNNLLVSRS